MAIQMNISGMRRNMKNLAHNYTDAQIKVREATSNDPWGPSSTLMSEIADFTYNVVAFSEIMQMLWKRLNDHGRNWRHVYKALVLLEYLIKTGSEKVADQCKENIFAIQTLKDFQYVEENKDQGVNVREKAKALVALLKDDERLRNERVRALKAKERFAQSVSGIGSDTDISSPTSPPYPKTYVTSSNRPGERDAYGVSETRLHSAAALEIEAARPQTVGEEELQLQLALAMSKEEAEAEEQRKKSDDVRLQMAITQSEEDFHDYHVGPEKPPKSSVNDLLDINFNPHEMHGPRRGNPSPVAQHMSSTSLDPWGMKPNASPQHLPKADPWGSPDSGPSSRMTSPQNTTYTWGPPPPRSPEPPMAGICGNDPWAALSHPPPASSIEYVESNDPWNPAGKTMPMVKADPFAPITSNGDLDDFSVLSIRDKPMKNSCEDLARLDLGELNGSLDAFDLSGLGGPLNQEQNGYPSSQKSKSPAAFLGENSNLVNLDNLVSGRTPSYATTSTLGILPLSGQTTTLSSSYSPVLNNNNHITLNSMNNNYNPFSTPEVLPSSFAGSNPFGPAASPNPFQAQQAPKPSMNQLRTVGVNSGPVNVPQTQLNLTGTTPGPWGPQQPPVGFGSAHQIQDENQFYL